MTFLNKLQRIALYLFFFSINFEVWDPINSGGYFSIAKLTAIVYVITIIPQAPRFFRIDSLKSVLFPIWIFFGFLTFMSMINSNELFSGFFHWALLLNMMLFWLLINHERIDYMIIERAMLSFVLGSVVLVLLFFAGIGVEYVDERLSMFGDNQNAIGLKVTISTIILLTSVIQNRLNMGRYRYLFLLIVPFMLICISETGSRVSAISFVVAFLTGTILYKTKTKLVKIGVLIGSAIVLILMAILLMQSEILVKRLERTTNSGDIASRDEIWRDIFPIIQGSPLIGIGKTGYEFQTALIWGKTDSPHNVILEVLCYTGITGLIIYLIFLFHVFKRGYQTYNKNGMLLPLLLIIPFLGLLFSGQILEVKIGWAILAYVVSASALTMKSLKSHKEKIFANENSLCN